jgi:MFS family permease
VTESSNDSAGKVSRRPSPFAFLAAAQFLSQFGDSVFQIAFIWLLLEMTGSKSATGLAATISYLPALLFGIVAGFLVDRWNRSRVLAGADAARLLLLALGGALYAGGMLTAPALTAIAFGCATAAVLFNPARDSILPELVPAGWLVQANAWIQASQYGAYLVGPLVVGVLVTTVGIGSVFPGGALLYGASLAFLLGVRRRGHVAETPPDRTGAFEDFRRGITGIAADRTLLLFLALTALDNLFIMGPALIGNAVMVRETLGGDAAMYAMVEATYGLGWGAGSLLIGRFASKLPLGKLLLWGITLDGLTYIPLFWCRSFPYLLVVSLVHSMVIPLITVPRSAILQRVVPAARLGRVFALVNVVVVGMTAVSSGLTGLLLERIDAPTLFGVIGILAGVTGLAGFASRRIRSL